MAGAAFFDLDGTLLTANSARLWVRRERRLGNVTRLDLLRVGAWLLGYHLGFLDMDTALRQALQRLKGQREDEIRAQTRAWWLAEVRPYIAPGARKVLDEHKQRGEPLVLLTSSSRYASAMAREEFGLDDVLCQGYEVRDGAFTGEPEFPLCYGPGKVTLAEGWAKAHGVDLAESAFYSDSTTDLPMLERVGRPFTVGPDPRLRRTAQKRGWPILDWSKA